MTPLENRLGYKFRNSLLLAEALTHPSLGYETHKPHFDNQRLEFLGDAVLQLVLTDELYRLCPESDEGILTKLRARLVSRRALAAYARTLGLGPYLMMGKGEEVSGGRERASTLADAFEALVGAVYLDAGQSAAREFVLTACGDAVSAALALPEESNPKGRLQELVQADSNQGPVYRITAQTGPDHHKTFQATVEWGGRAIGAGTGSSKKAAETAAALAALGNPEFHQVLEGRREPQTKKRRPGAS
jgi:ribonuclease-3